MKIKIKKKIMILLLLILTAGVLFPGTAFARAGGGGSSGGGSGGGGGSSNRTHHTGRSNGTSNPVSSLIKGAVFLLISGSGTIAFVYRSRKAKKESIRQMREFQRQEDSWDYREIQEYVEHAYFVIQECWRRYDPSYAAGYLSEELAEKWNVQLQWMKIRNEEIVQENVKLISAIPVDVHNEEGQEKDEIWYLIHGKMVGYYRDKNTKEVIRGNTNDEGFYEYWRFIRRNDRWVLHEICDKNDWEK